MYVFSANYGISNFGLKRILMLNLDHNLTMDNNYDNPSILHISLYPSAQQSSNKIESSCFDIKIPLEASQSLEIGNSEYSLAFYQLLLPLAYQFDPELIMVSIDSTKKKSKLTPEFYGHMVHHLKVLSLS